MPLKPYDGEVIPDEPAPDPAKLKPYTGAVVGPTSKATAGDVGKELAASAIESVGNVPQMGAELLTRGIAKATGSEQLRVMNPLSPISDFVRDSITPGGQAARQDSAKGDILDPSSWELPKTPSGYAMSAAQGFGSLASTLVPLGALKYAGMGEKALVGAGGTLGFAATGGQAAQQVRDEVSKMDEAALKRDVPAYGQHLEAGLSPDQARDKVANDSAFYASLISGVFGALQGGFNAKILDDVIAKKGISAFLGRVSDKGIVRAGVGATAGAVGEGIQEGMEQVGQNIGENLGRGKPAMEDPTRDTFGNVVMGAMVGGPTGGAVGAVSRGEGANTRAQPGGTGPETRAQPGETPPPAGPGLTAEQEDFALRKMERQAMRDIGMLRGQPGFDAEALTKIREGINAERADQGEPPMTTEEWRPVLDAFAEKAKLFPFITENAATAHAAALAKKTGIEYEVGPHPDVEGRFAVYPAQDGAPPAGEQPIAPPPAPPIAEAIAEPIPQAIGQPITPATPEVIPQAITPELLDKAREVLRTTKRNSPDVYQRMLRVPRETAQALAEKLEQRSDTGERARVAEMSPEQMRAELLTSPKAGIGNQRAYDEAPKKPVQASLDVDSLKWVNDNMGHAAGDQLIAKLGEAIKAAGIEGYHVSGDEFVAQFDKHEDGQKALDTVRDHLARAVITAELPDGSTIAKTGVGFSYGLGQDLNSAEAGLRGDKTAREQSGVRTPRGGEPAGVVRTAPAGKQVEEHRPTAEVAAAPSEGDLDQLFDEAAAEVKAAKPASVEEAVHEAATSEQNDKPLPTPAQIEAGNYAKGHVTISGLDVSIENPEGSTRSGKTPEGAEWSVTMKDHYGYIKGTKGRDKEHVDVFVKKGTPRDYAGNVVVVDQNKPSGAFDEHKVMLGWEAAPAARKAYLANYSGDQAKNVRSVRAVDQETFKRWLASGAAAKGPFIDWFKKEPTPAQRAETERARVESEAKREQYLAQLEKDNTAKIGELQKRIATLETHLGEIPAELKPMYRFLFTTGKTMVAERSMQNVEEPEIGWRHDRDEGEDFQSIHRNALEKAVAWAWDAWEKGDKRVHLEPSEQTTFITVEMPTGQVFIRSWDYLGDVTAELQKEGERADRGTAFKDVVGVPFEDTVDLFGYDFYTGKKQKGIPKGALHNEAWNTPDPDSYKKDSKPVTIASAREFDGQLYAVNYGNTTGQHIFTMNRLVPLDEWKGTLYANMNAMRAAWDDDTVPRGKDWGLQVTYRGKNYVIGRDHKMLIPAKPAQAVSLEEAKAAMDGYAEKLPNHVKGLAKEPEKFGGTYAWTDDDAEQRGYLQRKSYIAVKVGSTVYIESVGNNIFGLWERGIPGPTTPVSGGNAKRTEQAAADKARAEKEAARTVQLDLFTALKGQPDLAAFASATPEKFKERVEAMAKRWASEVREAGDDVRKAALDALTVDGKMLAALKREATAQAKALAALKKEEEKKKPDKLRNTGEDLRRSWELVKAQLKAKDAAEGITGMNRIFAATQRVDFFAPLGAADATAGTKRYIDDVRDLTTTFKDWVSDEAFGHSLYGDWTTSRDGPTVRIDNFIRGKSYLQRADAKRVGLELPEGIKDTSGLTPQQRLDFLSQLADQYVDMMQTLVDPLRAGKTVEEVAKKWAAMLWGDHSLDSMTASGTWRAFTKDFLTEQGMKVKPLLKGSEYRAIKLHPSHGTMAERVKTQDTIEEKSRTKPLVPPRLSELVRAGLPEVRKGDVTPKQFKERFGFADVGFGSWVQSGEDQAHLNNAWDAFADLAHHLGIEDKAIGFYGKLHFTLGALGQGKKAAATFHPGHPIADEQGNVKSVVQAINLTKTQGDGTVAHEWGHALDHFLRRGDDGTANGRDTMREIVNTLKEQPSTMEALREVAIQGLTGRRGWWTKGHKPKYPPVETATRMLRYYKQNRNTTDFKRNADAMDPNYWGNDAELFARAWESWVSDTLGDGAGVNNYLVNSGWVGENKTTKASGYKGTPYPAGEERKEFGRWMKALATSLKISEKGASVDRGTFADIAPDTTKEYLEAVDQLIADLPMMYEQIQIEKRAAEAAKEQNALIEAKAKADAERAAKEAAAAEAREKLSTQPDPVPVPQGELDKGDLERLFDEAADSAHAEAHENSTAPAPGAPALHEEPAAVATPKVAAPDKKAGELIADVAKLGVKGIDEALTGLTKLFGGGKIQSFPGGFDEETYKEAKPHFEAALKAFQAAGKTLKDLFKLLIEKFGEGVKPYAIRFAQEMKLTATLGGAPSASLQVATWVKGQLNRPGADHQSMMHSTILFERADEAFGGTQAEGKYTPKDAYDAAEAGMNLWILENANRGGLPIDPQAAGARVAIETLKGRTSRLPTATKRTQEQDEYQQFSTIPALAYVANWVANVQAGETMGEPSAGVGGLAAFAKALGANIVANELSSRRAAVLREVLPDARVFSEDGQHIADILPADTQPTVIVMNPPFSATAGRMEGKRDTMEGAKHVEAALKWLKPGGRLVAIVGNAMADTKSGRWGEWWGKTKERYNVRAVIEVNGAEYAKYGTTFDNAILVIDKTGPTVGETLTGRAESYNDLPALLEGVRNERRIPTGDNLAPERPAAQPVGGETVAVGVAQPGDTQSPGPRDVGNAAGDVSPPGGRSGGATGGKPGNRVGAGNDGRTGGRNTPPGRVGGDGLGTGGEPAAGDNQRPDQRVELDAPGAAQRSKELTDSIFEAYEPRKAKVKGAHPHPGKLVESAAMAAVEPIEALYTPNLPKEAIEKGRISSAQIEAVVYAGQAHMEHLPNGDRRGYFIGDGTGVGKGREIAAIILDNDRQGRKKSVWISASDGLIEDAKRDYGGVTGVAQADVTSVFKLRDVKNGGAEPAGKLTRKNGTVFLTYDVLRGGQQAPKDASAESKASLQTTFKQLTEWLGPDFDGVIAFDESHKIANLGGQKKGGRGGKVQGSQRAIIAEQLRKVLPQARIVYVSATGATEAANLAYADRLGLWGQNTPFANAGDFVDKIGRAGLAAMELVARDMKAMGVYISRSLSYDGVEQASIDATFTPLQKEIYDELARAWQIVLENMNEALKETGAAKNGQAKGYAVGRFWSSHQRFFNQVITSMMTPSVLERAQSEIAAGNAVLFQIVNTNEASQERQVAAAEADGTELEELDFSPKQILIDYLYKAFPTQKFEAFTDDEGKTQYRPVMTSDGKPVEDAEQVAIRDALIKHVNENLRVPDNPIDLIYEALGDTNVAEVSGRGRRFQKVLDRNTGSFKVEERKRTSKSNRADADAFMGDKKKALIFTDAGGTGYSFHSDLGVKNKRRRIHIMLQPGWVAANAMQGLGRSHRSNEANQPMVLLPRSDLKAQKRFISSIARRLDQLGALTKGQRNAASQGMFTNSDNLESKYAVAALRSLMEDLAPGGGTTIPDSQQLLKAMGLEEIYDAQTGKIVESKMPPITRFLNRLLSLTTGQQDALFSEFEMRMDAAVNAAIANGTFDDGMQTVKALAVKKLRDETVHTDQRSGARTRYVELQLTKSTALTDWDVLQETLAQHPGRGIAYYQDTQNGHPFAVVDLGERINAAGAKEARGYRFDVVAPSLAHRGKWITNRDSYERGGEVGQRKRDESGKLIPLDGYSDRSPAAPVSRYKKLRADEAQYLWAEAYDSASKTETEPLHMLTGALLPVWDRVQTDDEKTVAVMRTQTDDGERLIGRVIPSGDLPAILKNFGLGAVRGDMPATDIISRIFAGETAVLSNGWTVRAVRVANDQRLELTGPVTLAEQRLVKEKGAFVERISWSDRLFIPTGKPEVFEEITRGANRPVVDFVGGKKGEATFSAAPTLTEALSQRVTGVPLRELNEAVGNALDVDLPYDAFVARPLPARMQPAIAALEKAWNVKIVPFFNNDPQLSRFNGAHVGPGKLYVSVQTEHPLLFTIGHELVHEMRKQAPDLYAVLRGRVAPMMKDVERFKAARLAPGPAKRMTTDKVEEELIADLVGENFTKSAFWQELSEREPSLAGRLVSWIMRFLQSVENVLRGAFHAERFFTDVVAARKAVASAMGAFANRQAAVVPQSSLSFSGNPSPWYSELEQQIVAKGPETAPPAQWKAFIANLKTKGVKGDEIEWSGVNEWLDAQPGRVAKQDIQQFLAANGVKVTETMLGESAPKVSDEERQGMLDHLTAEYQGFLERNPELRELGDAAEARSHLNHVLSFARPALGTEQRNHILTQLGFLNDFIRRWETAESGTNAGDIAMVRLDALGYDLIIEPAVHGEDTPIGLRSRLTGTEWRTDDGAFAGLPDEVQELYSVVENMTEEESESGPGNTKFEHYKLPGGENYRELLLTLPISKRDRAAAHYNERVAGDHSEPTRPQVDTFHSSHFATPNILAHVRFDERTDAEGKRVLFIEEIQSDWAQKGKRQGFAKDTAGWTAQRLNEEGAGFNHWQVNDAKGNRVTDIVGGTMEGAIRKAGEGLPAAPFVGKTEAWVGLAMKRMIRYAAEKGFDRIAWTNGEQQADRYDLSRTVSRLVAQKLRWNDDSYHIKVWTTDGDTGSSPPRITRDVNGRNELADLIGKEMADRIIADIPTPGGKTYTGLDLKIGGEGMRAFYDKIIPNVANDVLKKLGGGRVGAVSINTGNAPADVVERHRGTNEPFVKANTPQPQPGFDITPELRERASAPIAMFDAARIGGQVVDRFNDLVSSSKQFNWWDRTVGTQLHKALKNPWFRRVFEIGQTYLHDVSEFASRAAEAAPNVLPKLDRLRDVLKFGASPEDLKAVGNAIFSETLDNQRFNEADLRNFYHLNDKQLGLYNEVRDAIDQSLDDLAVSEWARKTRDMDIDQARQSAKDNPRNAAEIFGEAIGDKMRELAERQQAYDQSTPEGIRAVADLQQRIDRFAEVKGEIERGAAKIAGLKEHGYAPLMRFGKYSVHVWTENDEGRQVTEYFSMYESEAEANAAARALRQDFPESVVDKGIMSQEAWRLFNGVSPDTLEVFAKALGADESEVFQQYLKLAVNNRSAMKRLIHRHGTPGFSFDTSRVLASFVTSNARRAAGNWHFADMLKATSDIPRNEGDVKDEAVKLVEYLQNPKEEATGFRSFLFAQFLGGSVASAMVNLTQPLLMTFPYLAKWGATPASMLRAGKVATSGAVAGSTLEAAMNRATQDGVVAPNEIHQLYAESIRSLGSNIWIRRFARAWGSLFAVSEAFNRRMTFAAAFELAEERGMREPYEFAVRAVEETQGIYNRGNRPNWARGAIGATLFTFKQFSIAYLEFLSRLPRREKALALGLLILAAGLQGLPFADDLDDLIDTLGQSLGYDTNTKRWKRRALEEAIGQVPAAFVLHGFSSLPGVPLDVQARLSVGNLIPGSAMFKRSEVDKSRDVLEFLGPTGSVAQSAGQAFSQLQAGKVGAAAASMMPTAIQNAVKAADMLEMGFYRDQRGRKVIETDEYDAAIKAIGFQPAKVAQESRRTQEVRQTIAMNKVAEGDIVERWAQGIFEKDAAKVTQAQRDLVEWNQRNPESPIRVVPRQVAERVQGMMRTREQRTIKSTPREMRGEIVRELQR